MEDMVGYVDLRRMPEEERQRAVEALIDRFVIEGNSLDQLMTDALAPSKKEVKANPNKYDVINIGPLEIYLKKELTNEQKALAYKILDLPEIDQGLSYVRIPKLGFDFQRSALIAIAIGQREGILETIYSQEMNDLMSGTLPYVFPTGSKYVEAFRGLVKHIEKKKE